MSTEQKKVTPMMQQFQEIKERHSDSLLFFRMGDFYEMFGDDAVEASKILGIALTKRNKGDELPMCGVPHHSHENYLIKLLRAGKKVAICEQLEDPSQAKGLVKRGVTRVVTPATVVEEAAISDFNNNFLLSAFVSGEMLYLSAIDISTGEVFLQRIPAVEVTDAAMGWSPKEIIANETFAMGGQYVQVRQTRGWYEGLEAKVLKTFSVHSLKTLGIEEKEFVYSLVQAIEYLEELMIDVVLSRPVRIAGEDRLVLDSIATRTLELVENAHDGTAKHTLFSVLNHCRTAMGSRLLKRWIQFPLRNLSEIHRRLSIIEYFTNHTDDLERLRDLLDGVYDIERIVSRILAGRANARDMVWLKNSIEGFPAVGAILRASGHPELKDLAEGMDNLTDITNLISSAITDEPPLTIKEGGIIRSGFNKHIDELHEIKSNSKMHLVRIETEEKEKSGISSLRVRYNKVFGYYIEVSKTNLSKVPAHFERKQTLVNAERFITAELKELESKILNADDKLFGMEYDVFCEVRDFVSSKGSLIRETAKKISELDCLLSLTVAAIRHRYVKPNVNDSDAIAFENGRHPVVEAESSEPFVANDIFMDHTEDRLLLITGPNMAGKSTYIRMTALIVLMAHMGSYVPASKADIGLVDRIFTRVGASDNLARGESTFMVEMVETANILGNATKRSLIILDEIGRGTSTFDGLSIAWAVVEYILNRIGAKTLFATHYHELTDIPMTHSGAKNYNVEVREWQGEIIFQRKIIPGSADRSYGIYVGQLAGLPVELISRANEILEQLEKNEFGIDGKPKIGRTKAGKGQEKIVQPILVFDENPVTDELLSLDIDNITPIQALQILTRLKEMARE